MNPKFWKLSQGVAAQFSSRDISSSLENRLVYVHKDTKAKGGSGRTQAQDFLEAGIGDYFYLTHGNRGVFALGQFSGPANIFSAYGEGWLDRPFRFIRGSVSTERYSGPRKWWAPSQNSTFTRVPDNELKMFEELILIPYFELHLAEFGVAVK